MIGFLKKERILLLFIICLFSFHWFSKDIMNPYERPIVGDAQAYYAYLPALFIYHDLEYEFMDSAAAKYYPPGEMKSFVYEVDGEKVNKTFPGLAVLYAPFFFIAHTIAHTAGFATDGFSPIYQLFFDIGLWCYFFFGLVFMRKLLEKLRFSSKKALFTTILIGIGTNLFFYTVYDQSVSHVFNFFLINGLLLCLFKWQENNYHKWLILAFVLLALIGIIRPTNILVFGLILFFFGKKEFFLDVYRAILSKTGLISLFLILPILAIPFLLWKAQTGNWVVYSYGEEGFNFANPYFVSFLFSYTKGWMTYTPIVIPILVLGFYLLFKISWKKGLVGLGFYLLSIYVFSSWWCWYYGAGMSQRVMIDHYILLAYLLALCLDFVWDKKVMRASFITVLISLSAFNVLQAYQIKNGIIKNGTASKESYWDNFFVLQQRAKVYPQEHWELISSEELSAGNWQTAVSSTSTYSQMAKGAIKPIGAGHKLVFSFEAKSSESIEHTRAVLMLKNDQSDGGEISLPYFIKDYARKDRWTKMEFMFEPLSNYKDSIKIYFWNGDTDEKVSFRNVKYSLYYSDEYL